MGTRLQPFGPDPNSTWAKFAARWSDEIKQSGSQKNLGSHQAFSRIEFGEVRRSSIIIEALHHPSYLE
jgi:hypothetical protein